MNCTALRGKTIVGLSRVSRVACALTLGLTSLSVYGQAGPLARPTARITAKVDNASRVVLAGNTHPNARPANDRGVVDPGTPMLRMILTLTHSDEQESALVSLIAQQQDKSSPNFHQWLTPAAYGAQFGASDADIAAITDWLTSQGFTIGSIAKGRNSIEFSGSAGQVTTAFQTPIHSYEVGGVMYQANSRDPSIPTALAPVVKGVLSLHNFGRKAHNVNSGQFRRDKTTGALTKLSGPALTPMALPASGGAARPNVATATPAFQFTSGTSTYEAIGPYDFATIYNLLPLWNAGIDGTGQTIAVLQETNIHLDDVRAFRSYFGLPANDPVVILNGPDPGVTSYDEGEADLDVQWSGAVAKNATILLVASASTATTAGTDLSALYAIDNNIAPITTLSYGECELGLGTAGNAFYNVLWQQGASQGISHFISTGDSGSASCDDGSTAAAQYGLSVSGMASTPYNTAVGGTDFLGNYFSTSQYWSATNTPGTNSSALGYIPETTWNDTCTNPIFEYPGEYASAEAACKALSASYREAIGGSGGVSACTTSTGGVVSSCSGGYAKPTWQTALGVPADGHRDIPDVSLMAGNGFFGSFYVVCEEDVDTDGKSCNFNAPYADFGGYGGTSISTPAFAGIMALVTQKTNERQGNANYVLYNLFNQQATAGTACTSSYTNVTTTSGTAVLPTSSCVFNDITFGSNSMACTKGSPNCYTATGFTYGILSTSTTTFNQAYNDGVGYDLGVGLGSVNATNLVNSWTNVTFVPTATTLSLSATTIAHGSTVNASIGVTPTAGAAGTPTGNVELLTSTTPSSLGFVALSGGSVNGTYNNLPGGTYNVTAYYAGDGTYAASTSTPVAVTVTPEASTLTGAVYLENESTGALTKVSTAAYGAQIYINFTPAAASGNGIPTGSVRVSNGTNYFGNYVLNAAGSVSFGTSTLAPGTYSLTATYSGDASFGASSTTSSVPLTITMSGTTTKLTVGTKNPAAGATETLTGTVVGSTSLANGDALGNAPTGMVSFYSGTTLLGSAPFTSYTVSTSTGATSSIAKLVTSALPYSTTASSSDSITAVYNGDANYSTSTSTATVETVPAGTKTATTSMLTTSSTPVYGTSTTLTSTLTFTSTNTPTGTITFYVDGLITGTAQTVASNQASVTAVLSGGAHTVTAVYSGDTNFLGSTGTASLTVGTIADQITLVGSTPLTVTQGTTLTYTATVPYSAANAAPTGTISFTLDGPAVGVPIGVNAFFTGGVGAYFNTNQLAAGAHTIGAIYSGDKNYAPSSATTQAAVQATPFLSLSVVQPTVIMLGAPVTVNVQAQIANGGPTPTGTITYSVDGGPATTISLSGTGAASFTLSGLSELKHTVLVTYNGNSNYVPTSNTIVLNGDVAQSILFFGLPNRSFAVAPTLSLSARATSGLPVTYAVSGPATLNGSILTLTGTGTVTVTASQAGNASFAAAAPVTQSFLSQ